MRIMDERGKGKYYILIFKDFGTVESLKGMRLTEHHKYPFVLENKF